MTGQGKAQHRPGSLHPWSELQEMWKSRNNQSGDYTYWYCLYRHIYIFHRIYKFQIYIYFTWCLKHVSPWGASLHPHGPPCLRFSLLHQLMSWYLANRFGPLLSALSVATGQYRHMFAPHFLQEVGHYQSCLGTSESKFMSCCCIISVLDWVATPFSVCSGFETSCRWSFDTRADWVHGTHSQ